MLKIVLFLSCFSFAQTRSNEKDFLLAENEVKAIEIAVRLESKLIQAISLDADRTGLAEDQAIRLTLRLCTEALNEAETQMRGLEVSKLTANEISFLIKVVRPSLEDLHYPHLDFAIRRNEIAEDLKNFPEKIQRLRVRVKESTLTLEQILTEAIDRGIDIPESLSFQAQEIAEAQKQLEALQAQVVELEEKEKNLKAKMIPLLQLAKQATPEILAEKTLSHAYQLMSSGQINAQIELPADSGISLDLQKRFMAYDARLKEILIDQVAALKISWQSVLIEKGLKDHLSINFRFVVNQAYLTAHGVRAQMTVYKTIKMRGQVYEEAENIAQFSMAVAEFDKYLKLNLARMLPTAIKIYDPKIVERRLSEMIRSSVCELYLAGDLTKANN